MKQWLGKGNHGEAWLLDDGTVLKLTNDWREYSVAACIKGRMNCYLVDVYDCWEIPNKDDTMLFAIKEERLWMETAIIDKELKKDFVRLFKHSWYVLNEREGVSMDFRYWEVVMDAYTQSNTNLIERMKEVFREQTEHLPQSATLYQMLADTNEGFSELRQLCHFGELDINSDNIGFTSNGRMKYFDMIRP